VEMKVTRARDCERRGSGVGSPQADLAKRIGPGPTRRLVLFERDSYLLATTW